MDEEKQLIENEPLKTGEETADAGQEKNGERLSWEQILEDPQYRACYDAAVQAIVQKRLKNSKAAEERLRELQPLLEAVEMRYGKKSGSMDAGALARLMLEELDKQAEDDGKILRHLETLMEQAQKLREKVPEFELLSALENPDFLRLTAPHTGLCLADAYYALNRQEIASAAAKLGLEALSRGIRSGGERPRELSDARAGKGFAADTAGMSKAQREELKKRIYAAAARKEKIFP